MCCLHRPPHVHIAACSEHHMLCSVVCTALRPLLVTAHVLCCTQLLAPPSTHRFSLHAPPSALRPVSHRAHRPPPVLLVPTTSVAGFKPRAAGRPVALGPPGPRALGLQAPRAPGPPGPRAPGPQAPGPLSPAPPGPRAPPGPPVPPPANVVGGTVGPPWTGRRGGDKPQRYIRDGKPSLPHMPHKTHH